MLKGEDTFIGGRMFLRDNEIGTACGAVGNTGQSSNQFWHSTTRDGVVVTFPWMHLVVVLCFDKPTSFPTRRTQTLKRLGKKASSSVIETATVHDRYDPIGLLNALVPKNSEAIVC